MHNSRVTGREMHRRVVVPEMYKRLALTPAHLKTVLIVGLRRIMPHQIQRVLEVNMNQHPTVVRGRPLLLTVSLGQQKDQVTRPHTNIDL
jgi:hypothetical protein